MAVLAEHGVVIQPLVQEQVELLEMELLVEIILSDVVMAAEADMVPQMMHTEAQAEFQAEVEEAEELTLAVTVATVAQADVAKLGFGHIR